MSQLVSRLTATIAISASLSDVLQVNGGQVAVIEMPVSWTMAVITFQSSLDGTNFSNVYHNDGTEVYVCAESYRRIHIDIPALSQQKYIKLRSGTTINPVAQGAARTIYVEIWS